MAEADAAEKVTWEMSVFVNENSGENKLGDTFIISPRFQAILVVYLTMLQLSVLIIVFQTILHQRRIWRTLGIRSMVKNLVGKGYR